MTPLGEGWTIEFLLDVGSLRGKVSIEELRQLKDRLPLKQAPGENKVGYEIEWDMPLFEEPKLITARPYIQWFDHWLLKPNSKLLILGEEIPVNLASLHGSTMGLYMAAQRKNPHGRLQEIDALATDASLSKNSYYFGFSKQGTGLSDPSLLRLGKPQHPVNERVS